MMELLKFAPAGERPDPGSPLSHGLVSANLPPTSADDARCHADP
jgi:hypothetical protein